MYTVSKSLLYDNANFRVVLSKSWVILCSHKIHDGRNL